MTLEELEYEREQISLMMIEAEDYELLDLEVRLYDIENLIEEIKNEKN